MAGEPVPRCWGNRFPELPQLISLPNCKNPKGKPGWGKTVMNGVPVARHGPILRENEATASGKLFKHLLGPPGPVFGPKTAAKVNILKINKNIKSADPLGS